MVDIFLKAAIEYFEQNIGRSHRLGKVYLYKNSEKNVRVYLSNSFHSDTHFFINNLVAKAPSLDLGKKLSNLQW